MRYMYSSIIAYNIYHANIGLIYSQVFGDMFLYLWRDAPYIEDSG